MTKRASPYQDYSDIIEKERPVSKKYPAISMEQRAAQFSPFAALTGLDNQMDDMSKQHEMDVILSEQNEVFTEDS